MCKNSDNWEAIGWPKENNVYHVNNIYEVFCNNCNKFVNLLDGKEIDAKGRCIIKRVIGDLKEIDYI